MKINAKLIIAFALALLITSVSVSYFSFSKAREIAVDGELKNMSEIINLIDINVTAKSRLIGNTIQTAATSSTIRYLFNNINKPVITLTEEGFEYLTRLQQELGQINGIFLLWGDVILKVKVADNDTGPILSPSRSVQLEKVATAGALQADSKQILNVLSLDNSLRPLFFGVDQSLVSVDPAQPDVVFAGIKVPSEEQVPQGILCEIDV